MKSLKYRSEIDSVNAAEWSALLHRFEDANLYQTWSYGAVRWRPSSLSHLILKRGSDPVAIAQLRIFPAGTFRCGIAYLRWGPLCHPKQGYLDPNIVRRVADALYEEYVRNRGLFLRILPNAFCGTPRESVFRTGFTQFRSERFSQGDSTRTIVLDLRPTLDEIRRRLDQKWRNQLNRAEKSGLKVVGGTAADEFRTMLRLYNEMWARKRFKRTTDIEEFSRIQESLPPEQKMRVLICEDEGVQVAGMIGTALGNSGIYLFGATNDKGLSSKGSYIMQWKMIEWLKQNGIRYYDLGGINPATNPGVYHFKKGLCGQEVQYMNPLVACNNICSTVFAQAATFVRSRLRNPLKGFHGPTSP